MTGKPTIEELQEKIEKLEQEASDFKNSEVALKRSEEKYRRLVDNLPSVVYKGYPDWTVEFFDNKIRSVTGYNFHDFNLKKIKWIDIIIKEDIEAIKKVFIHALKTDRSYIREYRIRTMPGQIHWIQERGHIVCDDIGKIKYISGVFFNITDRKQAEERLQKSEEMARALLNATTDAVVLINKQGTILDLNDTYARRFGKSKEKMIGLCLWYLLPRKLSSIRMTNAKKVSKSRKPIRMIDQKGGIWNDTNIYPVCNTTGEVTRLAIFTRNITAQKEAEDHIRTLTQQLMKAREIERQRIARDLHDNVAQDLSMLKIGLETLFDNQFEVSEHVRHKIYELSKVLQRSITDIRNIAYGLHPPGLYQLGLVRTVYQYCEEFAENNEINVDFFAAGMDDLKISTDTSINLYRLIQEALWNIKKHAGAGRITIKMVYSFPKIILRIKDDGIGFNVKDQSIRALSEKRMGLRTMEERVSILHGKLKIESRSDKGTNITIEVPYKEKRNGGEEKHIDHR